MKKNLFALIFSLLFAITTNAQNSKDYRTYGSTNYEDAAGIVSDSLGNNFIFGTYQGTLNAGNSITLQSQKNYIDFFLIKRDSTGQTVWARSFGANDTNVSNAWYRDAASDISIDKNGDLYLLGEVNCSADIIFGSITLLDGATPAQKNAFVSKFDKNGNCKWVTVGKTNPNAKPEKIAVDGNKRTYINSYAYGGEVFGTYTVTGSGSYVAMFDSIGAPLWAKAYSANINALTADKNGYVYCAGTTASSAQFGTVAISLKGNSDLILAKIDSIGNVVWALNEGNPGSSVEGYSIERHNNQVYVLGGHSLPLSIGSTTINANNKLFYATYNLSGINQSLIGINVGSNWSGGINSDIAINKQNELFLLLNASATFSFGTSNINLPGVGSIILKYTSTGVPDWGIGYISTANNGSTSTKIYCDNYNHLFVAGYFTGSMAVSNSATLNAFGTTNYDAFASILTTKNASVGLKEISGINNIFVFPNPAKDVLNLNTDSKGVVYNYSIINEFGQTISKGKITSLQNTIDVKYLSNGIYFITLNSENENKAPISKKFVIVR